MTKWDDQANKPDISTLNEPKTNSAPESRLCPHQLPLSSCGALSSNPVLRSLFPKHNFITCVVANSPIRSVWLCRYVFILYFIASALLFAISYKEKRTQDSNRIKGFSCGGTPVDLLFLQIMPGQYTFQRWSYYCVQHIPGTRGADLQWIPRAGCLRNSGRR